MTHLSLQKTDVMPILNYSWERSFSIILDNKNVMLRRVCNPINRALLIDPEILKTKQDTSNIVSLARGNDPHGKGVITLDNLNLMEGFSGRKMTQLLNCFF